jgi:hypothetical protein
VVSKTLVGKFTGLAPVWERLRAIADDHHVRVVATGRGSAVIHTAMTGPAKLQLYVTDLAPFADAQVIAPTAAFPNVELMETSDERVYFDVREIQAGRWASPVQTYLELMEGGPREVQTAEDLRVQLLRATEMKR